MQSRHSRSLNLKQLLRNLRLHLVQEVWPVVKSILPWAAFEDRWVSMPWAERFTSPDILRDPSILLERSLMSFKPYLTTKYIRDPISATWSSCSSR